MAQFRPVGSAQPLDMSGGYTASNPYMSPYAGQYTNASDAPIMPGYTSIYDPSTMSLQNEMQGMLGGVKYNQQPLEQLAANAESSTPSTWAQLQSQLARNNTNQALSQAKGQTAAGTAQAEGNLAMSGGLSSGAGERAQEAGEQAGIAAQQGTQNQGNNQLLNIGINDAANKQQEMMALPGMETQAYQTQLEPIQMMGQAGAQDIAHEMANAQSLNQFNMGAYGNQASMYGAGQTANAQQQTASDTSGLFGGGGFLGLGSWLCSERSKIIPLTEYDKAALSRLLRFARKTDRDFTKWYLRQGQRLVERIKANDEDWAETTNMVFIARVLEMLDAAPTVIAFEFYRKHVYALCQKYWANCPDAIIVNHPERGEWAA